MSKKIRGLWSYNTTPLKMKYELLALNRFKWNGLPKEIKEEYIEKNLYYHGQCAFFKLNDEFVVLKCSETGSRNIYGESLAFQVFGYDFHDTILSMDMVRIRSNVLNYPLKRTVEYYTDKIISLDDLENLNKEQQKIPFIISTTKENELSMKNLMNKVQNNEIALFVDKTLHDILGEKGLNVLSTNVPYLLDKIPEYRKVIERELLTILGINCCETDKKERQLKDEINANNEEIMANLLYELRLREQACNLINEMYGLEVSVEINKEIIKGGLYEDVHNRVE